MNRIYWDEDKIGMLTDQINAEPHKHWMMQIFLSLEDELHMCIEKEEVVGKCIIINQNILHAFNCKQKIHFSILVFPTSRLSIGLKHKIQNEAYYKIESSILDNIQLLAREMIQNKSISYYIKVMEKLDECLGAYTESTLYDERIQEVLKHISKCDCSNHSIETLSRQMNLSSSRLAHLFKQQIGMPLKSYILLHQVVKVFGLLLNGKTITEAALMGEFDTPSHFAATTKKMMGMSARLSSKDSEFLKVSDTLLD